MSANKMGSDLEKSKPSSKKQNRLLLVSSISGQTCTTVQVHKQTLYSRHTVITSSSPQFSQCMQTEHHQQIPQ